MKRAQAVILMFVLCLGVIHCPLVSAGTQTDDGLVAYWNFDTIATVDNVGYINDMTGNGVNLQIQNTTYSQDDGFRGKTLNFNGTDTTYDSNGDHLKVASDKLTSLVNGAEAITITGYIKKKSSTASTTNIPALKYFPGFGAIMIFPDKDEMTAQMRSGTSDTMGVLTTSGVYYATKGTGTNRCGWMQFAYVFDYKNKVVKAYIDGALAATLNPVDDFKNSTFLGSYASAGYFGIGSRYALMDEVKVYKRMLTDDEIMKSFPSVIEYDFEDVCDGTLHDLTGNKVDGTITGDVTVVDEGVSGKTAQIAQAISLPRSGIESAIVGAKKVSVSFWIKFQDGIRPVSATLLTGRASNGSSALDIKLAVGGIIGIGGRSKDTDSYSGVNANTGIAYGDDTWHHYLMTIDYATKAAKIYIDGTLDKVGTMANFTQSYMQCGIASFDATSPALDIIGDSTVLMDSVKFFRRGLGEDEIRALAQELPFARVSFSQSGNTMSAGVKIANQTGSDTNVNSVAILAQYSADGKKLISTANQPVGTIIKGGRNTITIPLENVDDMSKYLFKVFIWEDSQTLVPMIEPISNP